jgi:hypothetical protein
MRRVAAFGLLIVVLAGCGLRFHPGEAAVVDGTAITAGHVDDLVLAACDYSKQVRLSQGGAVPAQSTASLRSNLIKALIEFVITDRAASKLGLTVSDARIAQLAGSTTMPAGVSSSTKTLLSEFFHNSAKAQLQQAAIGAHLRDPSITTADTVTQSDLSAATEYLNEFAAKQHGSVDPSFGKWDGTKLVDTSGSLSDPVSATPTPVTGNSASAVKDLPPSQVCG